MLLNLLETASRLKMSTSIWVMCKDLTENYKNLYNDLYLMNLDTPETASQFLFDRYGIDYNNNETNIVDQKKYLLFTLKYL